MRGSDGVATIIDLIEAIEHKVKLTTGYKSHETATELAKLSNKKSSFNPNQPGYYRYYSCSHPNPEHQGPPQTKSRNITKESRNLSEEGKKKQDEKEVTTQITLENVAIDQTDTRMIQNEVGATGDHNKVQFGDGTIKNGLLTRTRYTSTNTEVVPTKDILFLSFQEHGYAKYQKGMATVIKGEITGAELYKAIKVAIKLRVKSLCGSKTITVKALEKKLYRKGKVKKSSTFAGVTGILDKDGALLLETAKIPTKKLPKESVVTGTTTRLMAKLLEDHKKKGLNNPKTTMDKAHIKYILDDVYAHVGARAKIAKKVGYQKTDGWVYKDSWKSPIFPVSDEKGYELFGAYQYGRGLDIVKGAQFDALLKQDRTRILNEDDIDSFLTDLHKLKTKDLTVAQKEKNFKTLATKVYERLKGKEGKLDKAFNRLTGGKLQGEDKKLGFIEGVSKALMTQTNDQVVANVPVRLSEIRPETRGDAACDCRGDTSDVEIFLADEGNYLGVQSPTDLDDSHIVSHYKEEMKGKVDQWKRRQDKLSGETE